MTGSCSPVLRPARAAALAVAAAAVVLVVAPAARGLGTSAGAATVKSAGNVATLTSGDSSTAFTLALPVGAACAGDSANDAYFLQSYMVPEAVDPATLQFNSNGPVPAGTGANLRQPLFDTTGSPYVNKLTLPATPSPGPGVIANIPDFDYALLSPGDIPPGTYNLGIACTKDPPSATQLRTFWNTQMTFTTNAGGGPAQVTWAAAAGQTTTSTTTTVAGTTTTTKVGTTTTTKAGTTTTTGAGGTTTTAVAGATTTTSAAGSTTTTLSNPLARTGGSSIPLLGAAVLLLVLGRMVVLVVRMPGAGTGAGK